MNTEEKGLSVPATGRRRLFRLIAFVLPVLFFGLLETGLRLANIGAYPDLFVPTKKVEGYLQPNEAVMQRFFTHPSQAPGVSIDTTYFSAARKADTLRIVVMGGSSAAGFPYGKWASPAGMLKRRLRRSYPERDIEVISTAMSAINSYALLDFTGEIIDLDPDAVVIYAGHNEYLGVLGVGSAYTSSQSAWLTRWILTLRRLHLYRSLESVLGSKRVDSDQPRGTLMARIAGERAIAYDSQLYHRGIEQFRGNMEIVLDRYVRAGIPVLIGTLASNELDQPPFTSGLDSQAAATAYQSAMQAGREAQRPDALEHFAHAVELDDGAADGWYALCQASLDAGDQTSARRACANARDRDQLRFRAPSAINQTIEQLAEKSGVTLVDVARALRDQSARGIVGHDLILEHLHPNERGYFLLADAFFDTLVERGIAGEASLALDQATAWAERPITQVDALAAQYRLAVLLADWPFTPTKQRVTIPAATTPIEQIAQAWYAKRLNWPDAMNQLLIHYQRQGDWDNAARVAQNLAEAFHFLGGVQFIAGQIVSKTGQFPLAVSYLERAVELEPIAKHKLALAHAYMQTQRSADARAVLATFTTQDRGYEDAQNRLRQLEE